MSRRALYSLIPVALLAGCSLLRDTDDRGSRGKTEQTAAGTTYKCFERDKCRVTVTVTACSAAGISANPNTLKVSRELRNVPIVWKLHAPPGYTFATDGINFKNKDLASTQFRAPMPASDEFVWEDANSARGDFPYNIKVRKDGVACPTKDPVVVNDD